MKRRAKHSRGHPPRTTPCLGSPRGPLWAALRASLGLEGRRRTCEPQITSSDGDAVESEPKWLLKGHHCSEEGRSHTITHPRSKLVWHSCARPMPATEARGHIGK